MPAPHSIGDRFGKLCIVGKAPKRNGRNYYNCLCECGTETEVASSNISAAKSCGCLRVEQAKRMGAANATHGMRYTPEWEAWSGMKRRCHDPTHKSYADYGGRGIVVCDDWRESFEAFFECVGKRPSASHTLDRIKVNEHYEPGNVRWATPKEQANNRRNNVTLTAFGETHTIAEWERLRGMRRGTLQARLRRGWETERAVGAATANSQKLSEDDVREIRDLRAEGLAMEVIADRFDICREYVSRITNRRVYEEVL